MTIPRISFFCRIISLAEFKFLGNYCSLSIALMMLRERLLSWRNASIPGYIFGCLQLFFTITSLLVIYILMACIFSGRRRRVLQEPYLCENIHSGMYVCTKAREMVCVYFVSESLLATQGLDCSLFSVV